jgi:predicted metal-binding membrane protein
MNIGAMLLLTALIFAEKALPFSRPVRIAAAGALATWGTLYCSIRASCRS